MNYIFTMHKKQIFKNIHMTIPDIQTSRWIKG